MRSQASQNLEDALELADLAERMVRARIVREHPALSEQEVERRVLAWLQERPSQGDADGRPRASKTHP